ncbi:hypothetical protein MHB50_08365 [Siminovitchia sp. FSL H7-0308]|uniref:Uncharacterized protein n=1 Tax=Siminovitchia thermophila TaxID=1245522 RepID=A0ABS2R9T5_9BACI|nr:hypothetical protein [Siminovitchia thermophila]MBM7716423.1 hypothetical protein [Siminovitchia thermophila]
MTVTVFIAVIFVKVAKQESVAINVKDIVILREIIELTVPAIIVGVITKATKRKNISIVKGIVILREKMTVTVIITKTAKL